MKISKVSYKKYKCSHCGHIKDIQTNHYGECYGGKIIGNTCPSCSWKRPLEAVIWQCQETEPEATTISTQEKNEALAEEIKTMLDDCFEDDEDGERLEKAMDHFCNLSDIREGMKHAIRLTLNEDLRHQAESDEFTADLIELKKMLTDENDTLLCTHKGCDEVQAEDGEFCNNHLK